MGSLCCICESTQVDPSQKYNCVTDTVNTNDKIVFQTPTIGLNEYSCMFKLLQPSSLDSELTMKCIDIPACTFGEIQTIQSNSHYSTAQQLVNVRTASENILHSPHPKIQKFIRQLTTTLIAQEKSQVHCLPFAKYNSPDYNEPVRQPIDVLEVIVRYYYNEAHHNGHHDNYTNDRIPKTLILTKWLPGRNTTERHLYRCEIQNGLVSSLKPLNATSQNNTCTSSNVDFNLIPGFIREELDSYVNNHLMGIVYFLKLEHVSVLYVDILVLHDKCELFDVSIPLQQTIR